MLMKKYQRMGIGAILIALLLLSNSVLALATESAVIEGEGSGVVIGDGNTEAEESYIINEDEIWAQIDKNELRSIVDIDALKELIDKDKLLDMVNQAAILETISDTALLEGMDAEEIKADFDKKKESGELDLVIKSIVEADDFDENFLINHPVDVPNVQVPVLGERSPFDFILDPGHLIYQTDAAKYGGGRVKENASVLFKNTSGEYTFSDTSDLLKIVNRGNVPVQLTIKSRLENTGNVTIVDSKSELSGGDTSMFMALVDDEGILSVLSDKGESEINIVLKPVPEGTYKYTLNEETGKYESVLSENADEESFDSFSFGLTADCNVFALWQEIESLPTVVVSWKATPILTDWDKVNEELEAADKVKFEAYKKVRLEQLRQEELKRLVEIELEKLVDEELDKLIDEEVERLAQERFEDLKAMALTGDIIADDSIAADSLLDTEVAVDDSEVLIINEEEEVNNESDNSADKSDSRDKTSDDIDKNADVDKNDDIIINKSSSDDTVVFSNTDSEKDEVVIGGNDEESSDDVLEETASDTSSDDEDVVIIEENN